jgi:hypothetical protein
MFSKGFTIFKDTKDLRRYSGYSGELSNAYELKGDYQKALEIYKEHISYEKSIFNDENRKEMAQKEIEYQFEKEKILFV